MNKEQRWLVMGILAVLVSGLCLIGADKPMNRIFWTILFGINCAYLPSQIADARRR